MMTFYDIHGESVTHFSGKWQLQFVPLGENLIYGTASTVANWFWWYFLKIGINKEESAKMKSICTKLIKEAVVIFVEVVFLLLILWIGGGGGSGSWRSYEWKSKVNS